METKILWINVSIHPLYSHTNFLCQINKPNTVWWRVQIMEEEEESRNRKKCLWWVCNNVFEKPAASISIFLLEDVGKSCQWNVCTCIRLQNVTSRKTGILTARYVFKNVMTAAFPKVHVYVATWVQRQWLTGHHTACEYCHDAEHFPGYVLTVFMPCIYLYFVNISDFLQSGQLQSYAMLNGWWTFRLQFHQVVWSLADVLLTMYRPIYTVQLWWQKPNWPLDPNRNLSYPVLCKATYCSLECKHQLERQYAASWYERYLSLITNMFRNLGSYIISSTQNIWT